MSTPGPRRNSEGVLKMVGVALLAFAFTFSLVPLYRLACEKVFGVRLSRSAIGDAQATAPSTAKGRVITVQFDGSTNSKLPWEFSPKQVSMQVRVGQQYATSYFARNTSAHTVVGSAVPSVAPARASGYFGKTECFCFTAQTLQAGEARDMPVRFIVDPNLPADISTLTLSYTFFKNDALTAQALQRKPGVAPTAPRSAP
jgi:cytochrome c oxidase assembly protein subunit 11